MGSCAEPGMGGRRRFGAINNPISLEIYADQNKSDGKLDKARKDYEGSNVYVSQYHSAYTDNEKIFASGDMTGKTISLSNMTVQAVVGEDGIGQAADLAQHATQGQAGGFGYGAGLVNQNGMSNAVIAVGSAEINVIGGASGLRVDGKYQHEGEQGLTGNAAIGGTGGAGAAGGNGGGAKAIGVAAGITDTAESIAVNGSASKNIQISGSSLSVNATGEAGGHGGYGGKGGSGADGAELRRKRPIKVQMAPMALMRIAHRIKPLMVKIRPRMQLMVRLQQLITLVCLLSRQAGYLLLVQLVRLATLAQLVLMVIMAVTLLMA